MVSISLYRGNLHRVPEVPRRWLAPTRNISLKDFRTLLKRRSKSLSLLRSSTAPTTTAPDPKSVPNPSQNQLPEIPEANVLDVEHREEPGKDLGGRQEDGNSKDGASDKVKDGSDLSKVTVDEKSCDAAHDNGNSQTLKVEIPAQAEKTDMETNDKVELNEKEKRKRDVEEKLEILNSKKHNLVQVLKQILKAEEECKRRNSMQVMAMRPSPLRVDASHDSGSMTRLTAPRTGPGSNHGGEMEGVETDDISNHNTHSRPMLRMSSTSPSSESPLRRPNHIQHNAVSHPSRAGLVATGSPSRFAPTGHQGHPTNVPTVSVTGTNYMASSPSPAASGGTSVFRDARLPSPWN